MELDQGATPEIEPVEIEQPKSMDDTIREVLQSQKERGLAVEGETPPAGAAPEAPEEAAQRIRDAAGKFAAKAAPAVPAVGTTPETPAPGAIPAPTVDTVQAAPNTWKKEAAAEWAKIPPVVQAEINRREANIHEGIEQYRAAATFAQTMEKAISPYAATIQSLGITPDVAVNEMMKTDHRLRYGSPQEKNDTFLNLARAYGIDVTALQNPQQQNIDPHFAHLQQELGQLKGYIQNQQSTAQQESEAKLHSEISAFAADPSHSHFEAVRGHMSALLQAGQAKDLPDAYEQAIYANPTTRAAVLAEQQAAQRAEAAVKAEAAKKAASVNVRARPSMPAAKPIGSMDDTIRETFRRLTNST
jgi:hypothetical protein